MESIKEESATEGLAKNIVQVKKKLRTSKRYSIGPELDRHIDAIINNSKAVAHVSSPEYKDAILGGCGEVREVGGEGWVTRKGGEEEGGRVEMKREGRREKEREESRL